MSAYIVRFNLQQRIEHLITLTVFALLCLTGLPQKFYTATWAHTLEERVAELKEHKRTTAEAADREAAMMYTEPPSYPRPVVEGWRRARA